MKTRVLVAALLALLLFGSEGAEKPLVSAYYYPWYDADGRHWKEGFPARGTDGAPALGEYSSRSEEIIRQHISWSKEFGISNWICSWWGPDSWENQTLREHILPALNGGSPPLTFCILYESQGLLELNKNEQIDFNAEKTERFAGHFTFLAKNYFDHPAYLRIDGKPVVYLYLSRTYSGEWEKALLRAREVVAAMGATLYLVGDEVYWGQPDRHRIRSLDAITSYNMHGPLPFASLQDWRECVDECGKVYREYREAAVAERVDFIPGVMPGFNSGGRHYTIPREIRDGAVGDSLFSAMLRMSEPFLRSRRPRLDITSFNEWHEGTQIEPSHRGDVGENGGAALRQWLAKRTR